MFHGFTTNICPSRILKSLTFSFIAGRRRSGRGAVVVTAAEGWHPGVVGLVAARLKEKFGRPAFASALEPGGMTGSGRSIVGVGIGRAVRRAVVEGLLTKGGGHAMAAGGRYARTRSRRRSAIRPLATNARLGPISGTTSTKVGPFPV